MRMKGEQVRSSPRRCWEPFTCSPAVAQLVPPSIPSGVPPPPPPVLLLLRELLFKPTTTHSFWSATAAERLVPSLLFWGPPKAGPSCPHNGRKPLSSRFHRQKLQGSKWEMEVGSCSVEVIHIVVPSLVRAKANGGVGVEIVALNRLFLSSTLI